MPTIPPQGHLFEVPDDIAYFNCASNAPQLKASTRRLVEGAGEKGRPWERVPPDYFKDAETIRSLASDLFGGGPDGWAIGHAASHGLSTAARIVEPRLMPGDRVLVMAEEFPSTVLAWRRTTRETGATLVTVPLDDRGSWTEAILERIDDTVRVVSVSTCHWTNGAFVDVRAIGRACRDVGSVLVVDATQTLGALPFPLADVQPDFLVAAGYKWLLSPYGFSLLYVSERWRDARPLEEAWQARANAEDFTRLVDYSDVYMAGARRFDIGEKGTPTILPGVIAALEQIRAWGIANIADSLAPINARIATHLERRGFLLPAASARCPHVFGAQLPSGYAGNLVGELRARRVYISQRGASLRFSPHLHVRPEDVERLLAALGELMP